jgi:hypothetical protein
MEAARAAQRRAIDEKAAELARQKAKEFEEKQKQRVSAAAEAAKKARKDTYGEFDDNFPKFFYPCP